MKPVVPPQHRRWLLLCAAGFFLLLIQPGLDALRVQAEQRGQESAQNYAEIQQAAQRFQDDVRLAQQADGQIGAADIDRLLAPVNRMRVMTQLEHYAESMRLSHYAYNLAPARSAEIGSMDAKDLIENNLTLEADAPHDLDAAGFVRNLDYILPGQIHVRRLVLSRAADNQALTLANLHLSADVRWLSNGSAP